MALADAHPKRNVPVFTAQGTTYSGYHAGGGQTTIAEFLRVDPDQYGLVLVDELKCCFIRARSVALSAISQKYAESVSYRSLLRRTRHIYWLNCRLKHVFT